MGYIYSFGWEDPLKSVKPNLVEGYKYWALAASLSNDVVATHYLEEIAKKMTPEQIDDAKQKAGEWLEKYQSKIDEFKIKDVDLAKFVQFQGTPLKMAIEELKIFSEELERQRLLSWLSIDLPAHSNLADYHKKEISEIGKFMIEVKEIQKEFEKDFDDLFRIFQKFQATGEKSLEEKIQSVISEDLRKLDDLRKKKIALRNSLK